MLLDAVRKLFALPAPPAPEGATDEAVTSARAPEVDPVHLAACALLLEIAWADGEFSAEERAHLEMVLERHFDLPAEAGHRLLELADVERREAIDQYGFTSVVKRNYDLGQKMVLAEVMWGLVLADGQIAEHEQYLTRKIANLLDLKPGFLASARKAVMERGGAPPEAGSGPATDAVGPADPHEHQGSGRPRED
jgi:uncharacterized tellurite resistance protein B-like protein